MNIKKYKYLKEAPDTNSDEFKNKENDLLNHFGSDGYKNYERAKKLTANMTEPNWANNLNTDDLDWLFNYINDVQNNPEGENAKAIDKQNSLDGGSSVNFKNTLELAKNYASNDYMRKKVKRNVMNSKQARNAAAYTRQRLAKNNVDTNVEEAKKYLAKRETIDLFRFSLLYGDDKFINDRIRSYTDVKYIIDSLDLASDVNMTASNNTLKNKLLKDIEKLTDQDIKNREKRQDIEERIKNFKDEKIKNEVFKAYNKRRQELKFKMVDANFKEINK